MQNNSVFFLDPPCGNRGTFLGLTRSLKVLHREAVFPLNFSAACVFFTQTEQMY